MSIFTLRLAGVAAVALIGLSAAASAPNSSPTLANGWARQSLRADRPDDNAKKSWQYAHPGIQFPQSSIAFLSDSPKAEESMVTVTPVFTEIEGLEPIEYSFAFATDDPDTPYRAIYFDEDFSVPFSMPEGSYDFIFLYAGDDGIRVILQQDVKVTGDMDITVTPPSAYNHLTYRPMLPNGEKIKTEVWVEKSEDEWECVEPGNCIDAAYLTMLRYRGRDFVAVERNIVDRVSEDGSIMSGSASGDLWLTPSDVFSSYQLVQACCPEGNVLIVMDAPKNEDADISNNPSDFDTPVTAKFADCMVIPEIEENPMFPNPYINGNIAFNTFYGDTYVASNSHTMGNRTWNYTTYDICIDPALKLDIELQPTFMKIFAMEYDEDTWEGIPYSIVAPLYSPSKGLWGAGHQSDIMTNNLYLSQAANEEGGKAAMAFNEFYSFPQSDEVVFGDNTPVTVFLRPGNFDYSYVGRYGEVRYLDNLFGTLNVKCDGEEVWNDYKHLNELFWSDEYDVDGDWEIETDNENLMVDGLKARNHCRMNFKKGERGLTPTVVQMQMRTIDGEVTDRFSTTEDALLTFYAGAFEYHADPATWSQWFTYQPLNNVKVEVVPYGSDEFTSLAVKEDESKFFMPGYGAYYYAELSQVTADSATGWFDVRISLEDNQGNTQVQTVSPAFKIASPAGVVTCHDAYDDIRVVGNNIIAPGDAVIFTADGLRCSGKNLQAGIYLVLTPRGLAKYAIH